MILTITLNPAWDITHRVDRLEVGGSNRVIDVRERPGGKGINVSCVLQQMGYANLATGLIAGATGEQLLSGLAHLGIEQSFVVVPGQVQTRRTVTVVAGDAGQATVLSEPGLAAGAVDWPAALRRFAELMVGADLVVLTGSLPPGVPEDAYGVLTGLARLRGVPVIVDAGGSALLHALAAGPDLVKPNSDELAAATGVREPLEGGRRLLAAGAARVVVSAGPDGLWGRDAQEAWQARPPALVAVNPTGAGDAAVAALAVGMLEGQAWPDLLRRAVAWSAAAVCEPVAGVVDSARARRLFDGVTVDRVAL